MAHFKVEAEKVPLPPKEILPDIFAFAPNPDSFGGVSYLIKGERHNFMVDVPEYGEQNIRFIENRCPEFIFLTHRDDVADAELFRQHFGAALIIQESEKYAVRNPDITFSNAYGIGGVMIIHTPGHSPGSSTLYHPGARVMFTGDHITADRGKPVAEDFSWTYDYNLQIKNVHKLLRFDFEYILAGHGGRRLISNAKNQLIGFLENHG
ncbi:MAG: MBL fold metallo-hydrolase [Candidatus Kryptoniota bacterium]